MSNTAEKKTFKYDHALISVSRDEIESTKDHTYSVSEYDEGHWDVVYPAPLSECGVVSWKCKDDAYYMLVIDRLVQPQGDAWEIEDKLECAKSLWSRFADTPINDEDEIEEVFLTFEPGTDRFEIWHWFESYFDCSVEDDLA